MLTYDRMQKAARLMHQVGELRPGFLYDESSDMEGPATMRQHPRMNEEISAKNKDQRVQITLEFKTDSETGEIFIVPKE